MRLLCVGFVAFVVTSFWSCFLPAAERINHAGRLLGPIPVVTNVVLFNTPESDAILSALQLFPRDNAWNEDISRRPLLANSDAMIAKIFSELAAVGANSTKLRAFKEMNFTLVPDSQPPTPIRFVAYPEESDPSPYPIPSNLPIEGWPSETGAQTLEQVQRATGGDRHAIIIQPGTGWIWETWQTRLTTAATNWEAANGAKFSLTSNAQRPTGWTSADAAGLSMLGGLVRFDECERGEIEHALRMIVKHTRREFIYPATHHASSPSTTDPNVPAMGQRLRLKAEFVVPANWTRQERAIAAALKKYGGLIADNSSSFFSISVVPDQRWPSGAFSHLTTLAVTNFEVVQTTGPNEGPRSPGAPIVSAGPDQALPRGVTVTLAGSVLYTNPAPLRTQWTAYRGPGPVVFGNPSQTNTAASFGEPGRYTLRLMADDGVHTPSYAAVTITVSDGIRVSIQRLSEGVLLDWVGGEPPYEVEYSERLPATAWRSAGTFPTNRVTLLPATNSTFFRVREQ